MAIRKNQSSWVKLIIGRERDVDIMLQKVDYSGVARIIRGKRCATDKELFQEFAAALQFPYYFGENWSAFDECINDLSWLNAQDCLIVITNCDHILTQSKQFGTFIEVLRAAHESIQAKRDNLGSLSSLQFIFHTETKNSEKFNEMAKNWLSSFDVEILDPFDDVL